MVGTVIKHHPIFTLIFTHATAAVAEMYTGLLF